MKKKLKIVLAISLIIFQFTAIAQTVTLEHCQTWTRENYPLTKKLEYIYLNAKYQSINANKAYFPQFNVNGQGTYQSDVTSIPNLLPDMVMPTMAKDQYRIQGELVQTLFDGGFRTSQINLIKSGEKLQEQQVEVSLYGVRQQVTDLYFAVLLYNAQLRQHALLQANLHQSLEKAKAALKEGTTFKANINELQAGIIQADMQQAELETARNSTVEILSKLSGQSFTENTVFEEPIAINLLTSESTRPEITLLNLQKDHLLIQKKQAASDLLPTLSAFALAGYGRPTLNMLDNSFGTFWMAGLKLKWSINTLMSLPNTIKSLSMSDKMLDTDKETFELNTKIELSRQTAEMQKYQSLLQQDSEIIRLREQVLEAAKVQLQNGVITTTDYLTKLNAENLAKETKEMHRLLLLKVQYKYHLTLGK